MSLSTPVPSAQVSLASWLDEPFLYHDVDRPGFTCLFTPSAKVCQRSFKLDQLPKRLDYVRSLGVDAFVAQNEFFRPNRQAAHLWRLTSNYVDLDTYKIPGLELSAERLAAILLMQCDDLGVPEPSVVVFSGRGLQAKWVLETPLPASALPRWDAVQKELCRRFENLGSDPLALDASRVLRVVGTPNSKSGEMVRVVHCAQVPTMGGSRLRNGSIGYDFELFAETLLPMTRRGLEAVERASEQVPAPPNIPGRVAEASAMPKRLTGAPRSGRQLAGDRLSDLHRLVELRGWGQGAPAGQRNTLVFLAACFLSHARAASDVSSELLEFARRVAPTWSEAQVISCASGALSRARATASARLVSPSGEAKDRRYRHSNIYLVQVLKLTPAEESAMQTIIGLEEARSRDRRRKESSRRAQGAVPRAILGARAAALQERAQELRKGGRSLASIAGELGISRTSAFRYCRSG